MNQQIRLKHRFKQQPRWFEGTTECINCAMANMLNDEGNQQAWYGVDGCAAVRERARAAHAACEAPGTCTCKHIIGLVLSPDDVATLTATDDYTMPDYATGGETP